MRVPIASKRQPAQRMPTLLLRAARPARSAFAGRDLVQLSAAHAMRLAEVRGAPRQHALYDLVEDDRSRLVHLEIYGRLDVDGDQRDARVVRRSGFFGVT